MEEELQLFQKGLFGQLTPQERQRYIDNFMDEEEKAIGVPMFEMSEEQNAQAKVMQYNKEIGYLKDFNCKKCLNKGLIAFAIGKKVEYKYCKCQKLRNTIVSLKAQGLFELFKKCHFDNFVVENEWQKELHDKGIAFKASGDSAFVALGQAGCGKTHVCMAVAREFAIECKTVAYMSWVEDSRKLKALVNKDQEAYAVKIYSYKSADVLYIDDFFKTNKNATPTTADISLAFEIIDCRYKKALSMPQGERPITIISSERTLKELCVCDEAIGGRLYEMAGRGNSVVQIDGKGKDNRFKNTAL